MTEQDRKILSELTVAINELKSELITGNPEIGRKGFVAKTEEDIDELDNKINEFHEHLCNRINSIEHWRQHHLPDNFVTMLNNIFTLFKSSSFLLGLLITAVLTFVGFASGIITLIQWLKTYM